MFQNLRFGNFIGSSPKSLAGGLSDSEEELRQPNNRQVHLIISYLSHSTSIKGKGSVLTDFGTATNFIAETMVVSLGGPHKLLEKYANWDS